MRVTGHRPSRWQRRTGRKPGSERGEGNGIRDGRPATTLSGDHTALCQSEPPVDRPPRPHRAVIGSERRTEPPATIRAMSYRPRVSAIREPTSQSATCDAGAANDRTNVPTGGTAGRSRVPCETTGRDIGDRLGECPLEGTLRLIAGAPARSTPVRYRMPSNGRIRGYRSVRIDAKPGDSDSRQVDR